MELPSTADVPLSVHSTILVYPFRHAITGHRRARRLRAVDGRWKPWWSRLGAPDERRRAIDDSYFFLPYIRSLLDPETALLGGGPADPLTRAGEIADEWPAAELARRTPTSSVIRLTLPLDDDPAWAESALDARYGDTHPIPFRVRWVDVVLFPQGVGYLMLKSELAGASPTFGTLRDFLWLARQVQPFKVGWTLPMWRFGPPGAPIELHARDLADYLVEGLTAGGGRPSGTLSAFAERLNGPEAPPRYSASDEGMTYGDAFRTHTYALLGAPAGTEEPGGPFASRADRLVYELATCTDTSQPMYVPDADYYRSLLERGRLALWRNWVGLALTDHVAFLGLDPASGFLAGDFPHNVESDYLRLHLLARFQKDRLTMMFGELIRRERDPLINTEDARLLWESYNEFQNAYWFLEVTRKPIPTELYRRFQAGLGTLPMYEEMSTQVTTLQSHYERLAEIHLNTLLNAFAIIGLPAGLVVGVFSTLIVERPGTYLVPFLVALAALFAVVVLVWAIWRYDLLKIHRWWPRLRNWFRRHVLGRP